MNLITEKDVSSLSLYSGATTAVNAHVLPLEKQVLAVVTDDGTVELFTEPFSYSKGAQVSRGSTASLKERGKQMTRRANALVKVVRSDDSETLVPVIASSFQGPELVVAWAEGGITPVFERIRWLDGSADGLSFTGVKKVVKSKSGSALGSVTVNGTKSAVESHVDESKAVVEQGNLMDNDVDMPDDTGKDYASAESTSGDDDESEEEEEEEIKESDGVEQHKNPGSDIEMENAGERTDAAEAQEEDGEEAGEPSFGDLLRARGDEEEIDVEAELENVQTPFVSPPKPTSNTVQQIPSGVSLSTVLAQSLKTNDSDMLESCFHAGDLSIVRTTIQRLDSMLAATLLQRLAERLSSRPGRYGHLLVWVQWTCVAHGGALAGRPDLLKRMNALFKVMDQRSASLPSLLLLKGKLDMLDAQLGLRQSLWRAAEGHSDDEDNVIYVEGEEDDAEDSDANNDGHTTTAAQITPRSKSIRDQAFDGQDEVMVNGVVPAADESEEEEEDDDEEEDEDDDHEGQNIGAADDDEDGNLLDTEAEESAGSSDAEESVENDDDEDEDDGEDSGASMQDFIADSDEVEDEEEDLAPVSRPPQSKKAKKMQGDGAR